jgi:hypothetical protein
LPTSSTNDSYGLRCKTADHRASAFAGGKNLIQREITSCA